MTDAQRAARAKSLAQQTTFGYRIRPHSPKWNEIMRLLDEIIAGGAPPPPPPPPPPTPNVAPRTYNRSPVSDARYCVVGLDRDHIGYVDAFGHYDENGLSLGGRDESRIVEVLKASDSMDGRGACDAYSHNGRSFPPWPAESYLR